MKQNGDNTGSIDREKPERLPRNDRRSYPIELSKATGQKNECTFYAGDVWCNIRPYKKIRKEIGDTRYCSRQATVHKPTNVCTL